MSIQVHIFTPTNPRLGRHVEHDTRSRAFAFTAAKPLADKDTLWSTSAPVLDQGQLGSCTGNATAQLLNCDYFTPTRGRKFLTETKAKSIYSLATKLDNIRGSWKPDDTGSTGIAAAKAGVQLGYFSKYQHTFSFDQFRAAIQVQPVIVGSLWTYDMENPDRDGVLHVGDLSDNNIAGGHEYLCRGISYTHKQVVFRNSWGPGWGVNGGDNTPGTFYMSFTDFEALLANQGDVTAPIGAKQ